MLENILPFAHINAYLILDGQKYEIEKFTTNFIQPSDFKGQPQHEVKGGKVTIVLSQTADDNLYLWAKQSTLRKGGEILFQTDLGITVLRINFTNAYCINLTREINALTGTKTSLVIAPEIITLNGIEHNNFWENK